MTHAENPRSARQLIRGGPYALTGLQQIWLKDFFRTVPVQRLQRQLEQLDRAVFVADPSGKAETRRDCMNLTRKFNVGT